MPERAAGVLAAVALVTAAAGVALWTEAVRGDGGRAAEFQRLIGGLGFGPALHLDGCAAGFDPRLDADCAWQRGPVPGGRCFCPRHAGAPHHSALTDGADREAGDAPAP